MKHLVVLSGAGISAESGIKTFRDADGLWEGHDVMEVAPNLAHKTLKELEQDFKVSIVTQNVDNLHERAGSSNVLHLHGELLKVRSSRNEALIYDWEEDVKLGDLAEDKAQLRPHIVWFGEAVPAIEEAIELVESADILLIIGTSMQVYPAAGLINYLTFGKPIYLIDPKRPEGSLPPQVHFIEATACNGIQSFVKLLKEEL